MPSACGLACEVCGFLEKGLCPIGGRIPGTDPKAPEKLEKFKEAMGHPCMTLECAIGKQVDHCRRGDDFPCEVHYKQEIHSHKLLDMIKGMLGKE
ncbi:hypothetical protein KAX17_03280 [Candidatus Bipolaricaulota bacterium]|nr:hypothetical protein [Candidatus Bipolaricaulota bacterium]MCK4599080.1 hypothetical protein [Candidatus Bipolaricaulota bacterium]